MIYELRTYTLKQGSVPEVAKNSGTVGRDIRKDDYGKLEGYWVTEIGPLNQVMHMWSYESVSERQRLRAELAKNKRWTGEYVPLTRPHLVRQDNRLLNAVIAPTAPASAGNIYEFRNYRTRPGAAKQLCRCARNIPRSWGCGPPKPGNPTRSATCGPTLTSTPARPCAPSPARTRAGRRS